MGESLFKGLKVNGSLYTGKIEGLKVNDTIEQGFFLNGNWYEPGPFECILKFEHTPGPASTVAKIFLKEGVSSITYYIDGVEYSKAASTEGRVDLYQDDGLTTGVTLKIYDGMRFISLEYSYIETNSKGNTSTKTALSVERIIRWGQYITHTISGDVSSPVNIPCNITTASSTGEKWQRLLGGTPLTIPISLSEYICVKNSDGTCEQVSSYLFNWQRPDDPNNKCTTLYAESPIVNIPICYNVYLVPVSVNELVLSSSQEGSSLGYFYIARETDTPPTICVFWDRNGYIKGDSSKPVTNFSRIAPTSTSSETSVCPIVKYWGEWGKSTLSSLGYNMALLAYPELLPD